MPATDVRLQTTTVRMPRRLYEEAKAVVEMRTTGGEELE
jgi:hypothetical protein